MKTSTQLKALIRNVSKENSIKPEILLRNFMLERLLESITLSKLWRIQYSMDNGLDGVHRWVSVGPMKLKVASILLPVLIIQLWRISNIVNWWVSMNITIAVSILLALQPDASQQQAVSFL